MNYYTIIALIVWAAAKAKSQARENLPTQERSERPEDKKSSPT